MRRTITIFCVFYFTLKPLETGEYTKEKTEEVEKEVGKKLAPPLDKNYLSFREKKEKKWAKNRE